MDNATNQSTHLVPAVCTQCGGQLEVDPSQEAAVCKYCGTPFIVEKAIQNYNVQHATIEHVDNVNIDMKGTADSFFSFLGTQMSERRALRREERKERRAEERETSREMRNGFFKMFRFMMLGMFILAIIMFLFTFFRGDYDPDTPAASDTEIESVYSPAPSDLNPQENSFSFSGQMSLG
ncbi:MAG: hypothetical protein IJ237_06375 [Oscillospiraceae bacterium]|nr:hypothetical protein [Oscillospiraceae bacterium]